MVGMRNRAVIAVAAAALAGGGAGALIFTPALATAQDDPPVEETVPLEQRRSPLADALSGLVEEGVINQAQADAVQERLEELRPQGRRGPGHHRGAHGLETAAGAIGIEPADLRDALMGGQSMAEVAETNGVEPQVVIDALVAETEAKIAEKVEEGRIDQQQADDFAANAAERIEAMVNGTFERPEGFEGFRGRRGGFGPRPGFVPGGPVEVQPA